MLAPPVICARWYKDIGSKVNKGELLADIETPEVDQELMQARAARDQATAQLKLAQSSAKRWENLQKMDAVSQQETDERSSSYIQGEANLNAANANVRRLEQLESFQAYLRAFLRCDYNPQYGCGCAGQCRQWRTNSGAICHRAD